VRRTLTILTMSAAIGLAACGYDKDDGTGQAAAAGNPAATAPGSGGEQPAGSPAAPGVAVGQTALGEVLTDADGFTLYGLTDDTPDTSSCDGGCAETWPPLLVDGAELPAGLDPSLFGVIERSDGTFQLRAGDFPLYRFAGDEAPGDTNGQGSGGVWFAVSPTGELIGADTTDDAGQATAGETTPPTEPAGDSSSSDDGDSSSGDGYGDDNSYGDGDGGGYGY
jgi:predicted lipoprotein with Yx(FWY)xxD motif